MFKPRRPGAKIAASTEDAVAGFTVRNLPYRSGVHRSLLRVFCLVALTGWARAGAAYADGARFDLTGPKIEVRVTRAGVTLPIASVPNLQPGDRLWLHPDLPPTQSVHYLLVLAFLRGTTNPPPDNWFLRVETWDRKVREEGVEVTVPDEAQQAVLFLAPVTGGDFSTLRSAVQGRPGIFVRASQDLDAAGFEQARIEKYIAAMRELSPAEVADPKQLQEHSNQIAATLALKPNADCAKLSPDQQYTCLTQAGGQTLLDDGHGQSIIDALTGGASQGLIGNVSSTQLAGGGLYSAYVGSIVDLVHIMGSLHTAQYQYIPAIAFPQQQSLNLRLNTPPSFHNPKSVIVIGLPSVQRTTPPPLRATNPNVVSCLQEPGVVLPVEGAPLVFSTGLAHDLVLHLNYPSVRPAAGSAAAQAQDIPLTADALHGGLVLAPMAKRRALSAVNVSQPATPSGATDKTVDATTPASDAAPAGGDGLTGTVTGFWGFDTFTGPTMPLQNALGKEWKLAADDPLIAGRNQHILVVSTGTACIQSIALEPASGKAEKEAWKSAADKPNTVDVTLDLPAHDSGTMRLAIHQFGDPRPATVSLVSYSEPAKLDALSFHAGDSTATLTGSSLNQVRQVQFGGLTFKPAGQGTTAQPDGKAALQLQLPAEAKTPTLPAGDSLTAQVALNDGRTLKLPVTVEPARPTITLISKADVPADNAPKTPFAIKLASADDLPVSDSLIFSLKSTQPFPRDGKIEIASPDGSLRTTLSVASSDANASLILEGPRTLLATLQPLKAFGPSAFGPIKLRAVAHDGSAGDWLPLVTLVRLPAINGLSCPVATPVPQPSQTAAPMASAARSPAASPTPSTDTGAATNVPAAPSDSTAAPSQAVSVSHMPESSALSPTATTSEKPAATASPATSAPATCTLSGSGLYFIDSIATDAAFTVPARVPEGFVGSSITVPPPTGGTYYLRLRDDPTPVDTVTLPAGPL
jgi:hypothetical protein